MDEPNTTAQKSSSLASDMVSQSLALSQLVSSHITHDLASPIGALMTGLELLESASSAGMEEKEVFELLQRSCALLRSRLDLFRMAYAAAGQPLNVRQVRTVCAHYFETQERVLLKWEDQWDSAKLEKGMLQVLMHVLIWLHHKVPKQGELCVRFDLLTQTIQCAATSNMLMVGGNDEAILSGKLPLQDIDAQHIQPYFIFLLSCMFGVHLTLDTYRVDEVKVRISPQELEDGS